MKYAPALILAILLLGAASVSAQFVSPPPRTTLTSDSLRWQRPPHPALLPPTATAEHLPFFCRIERRWEQRERLPLKFRLCSVAYVDWLEGKRPAY